MAKEDVCALCNREYKIEEGYGWPEKIFCSEECQERYESMEKRVGLITVIPWLDPILTRLFMVFKLSLAVTVLIAYMV